MPVLINKETGQAFEVEDAEVESASQSMGLVPATQEQIDWLQKRREYDALPIADKVRETGQAYALGIGKIGRELGRFRLDDSGMAQSLFPEQAQQVSDAQSAFQQRRDATLDSGAAGEVIERHPLAYTLGVDTPALFISPGVGGSGLRALGGMAAESAAVGLSEEAVARTDEGRDFDIGNAANIAAQDLAFSGLAAAATKVASRVGNLLMFGAGNTTAKNVKRGLDETAGPVVPDDVRFDGPLLEAETRSRRTAAATGPGMPPGPERDELLRRSAADLNDQVKTEGGDLIDSTLSASRASASVTDEAVSRRIDEALRDTTPAQTAWSADATRKLDDMRTTVDAAADEAVTPFVSRAREIADEAIAAIDGSAESASWFRASSAARERLDSLVDDMTAAGLPAQPGIEAAREFLGRTLTDRALFGGAADMHAGLHGLTRDKIASAVNISGGDMRAALGDFVSADAATRQQLRRPLEQAIEGFEELAAAHERFGTGSPKTIENLRDNAAKLRRGLKLADDVQSAQRSAPKAPPRPPPATAAKEPDFTRADTVADQIRKKAAQAGVAAAQRVVDYAAGPGRAVYDDAVSDALKGAIQTVGAIGGLAAFGPAGFAAGWLGARSLGKKYAPQVGQQILDAAQRYVKKHGADTAGAALLATAALGDDGEDDDSDTLAASVGGLFFAKRFAERALGAAGRGVKAAGKGAMKASEAVAGTVDAATGKAAEAIGQASYKAGRKVGEALGSTADVVAKSVADEEAVKRAISSGIRDPKRWLSRNTRGRVADKVAEYFGPRISKVAQEWLEKRGNKSAQEVVDEAVTETAEAGKRDSALLEEHSAQSVAMVEDVGAQIRNALNETAEQKARALAAFPQRIGGDANAQRQLLGSAVDELASALGKVSDGTTAKVAVDFANAAKEAIMNARTAKDRFRIGMQLTETLVHHTAEAGDGEMAKVFGAYADKMWEAMGQREVWMGARELEREMKRVAKKRESIISKISAGEKLGIAALVGSAAVEDEDTAAALAATGGIGALVGKGRLMKLSAEAASLAETMSGSKPSGKLWASVSDVTTERALADGLASKYNTAEAYNQALEGLNKTLDPQQKQALINWSHHDYKAIQANMAGETAGKIVAALDRAIAEGLTVPGEVSRGVMLTADEIDKLKSSKEFQTTGFMATSANRNYPRNFLANKAEEAKAGKVPVILQVHQSTGVPIPGDPRESEILLRPGTKFDVRVVRDEVRKGQFEEVVHLFEKQHEAVDPRQLGTIPPKGKAKRPDGPIAAKPERDVTPTKFYPNSNQARNEYGEQMRPYREAQKADNTRMAQLAKDYGLAGAAVATGGGVLAMTGDAKADEPEDRMVAAERILAIDQAATQRIRHTARVLAGLAEPPSPEGLTTHLARFGAEHDDPRAAFDERKEILAKSEISPALVYDVLGSSMGDVASVSPELYQAATARILDNFRYLRENLPPEVKTSLLHPKGLPVSESAMRDWATQWSTAMDPESVLDDIERGTVTHLQIETLRNAHPDIYQQMRTEIIEEVGANFASIPTSTKMQLDILFGADGLAGPMFSSEAAAIIGAAGKIASQRKQPGPPQGSADDQEAASSSNGLEAIRSSVTNRGA